MDKTNKSALKKNKNISISEITNAASIKAIKKKRKATIAPKTITQAILNKNITALSRAITLIESTNPKHLDTANTIIKNCLPYANKSIRIGITGVPGVGKSTFIERFGTLLTDQGKQVAILAIDPTSRITKGSILGDKTRMPTLINNNNVFIRPSASGDTLGGVAKKTRESIILCEAAGFNVIIIETVGVGQSETTVHSMVDFFLLLKLAGAGDELQGIKRGIIEMADAVIINKADGENVNPANLAKIEFSNALHLFPKKTSHWQPIVSTCSALNNEGITEVWKTILNYLNTTTQNNYFNIKRQEQNKYWLIQTIENRLKSDFFNQPQIKKELSEQLNLLENDKTTPFSAAEYLLNINKSI